MILPTQMMAEVDRLSVAGEVTEAALSVLINFAGKRCIGESPPKYGSRKAFATVPPGHEGDCYLYFKLSGTWRAAQLPSYRQARTAATMAIFSPWDEIQSVFISGNYTGVTVQLNEFASARIWYAKVCELVNCPDLLPENGGSVSHCPSGSSV